MMVDEFIVAACVPPGAHASGTLEAAEAILAAHPEVSRDGIAPAAILGDPDALHHSLARDNALALLEALLDHGADPGLPAPAHAGRSAVAVAARAGRADALELFQRRGFDTSLDGDDAFFAALARGDRAAATAFTTAPPDLVRRLEAERPGTVGVLAGAGNAAAVALALDLGFALPADALARAVWRERSDAVRVLLARGAPVTADVLALAERALTEPSDFTPHRSRAILDLLTSRSSG